MGRETRNRTAATPAAAPQRKLSDVELAQIHDETKRLDVRERIIYWDRRQGAQVYVDAAGAPIPATVPADDATRIGQKLVRDPAVILCPNDAAHGALMMTGSGALLICGARKQGAVCTGSVPVSL